MSGAFNCPFYRVIATPWDTEIVSDEQWAEAGITFSPKRDRAKPRLVYDMLVDFMSLAHRDECSQ